MIISNYEIGKEIGSGSFGTVNIAEHLTSGDKVAVKCISKTRIQKSNMGAQVKKEIMTMKRLRHPNIVLIKEVLMSNTHLYLVLEYAGGGELFTKIATHGKLAEKVARRYFKQIMEAVQFCHSLYVCHRDIKPENILLDHDDNVKIADFGFASIMEPEYETTADATNEEDRGMLTSIEEDVEQQNGSQQSLREFVPDPQIPSQRKFRNLPSKKMQKMSTMCGTTQYMAPEIVNRDSYRGDKADIWSCGIVLFVLVAGYLPFDSSSTEVVFRKIQTGTFSTPPSVTNLTRDVIQKLLTPNPLFRPGAKTILSHEWFRDMGTSHAPPVPTRETPAPKNLKVPPHTAKDAPKLVAKSERIIVLNTVKDVAHSKVVDVMRANAWMQKTDVSSGPESGAPGSVSTIRGSKMTSTGLALIQLVLQSQTRGQTRVEIDVCGTQKSSGARDINKLVEDIKGTQQHGSLPIEDP